MNISARLLSPLTAFARAAAVLVPALVLGGCSSSMLGGSSKEDALKALQWSYGSEGVQIAIDADPRLNLSDGQPHSLAVTVVQVADPTVFAAYTKDNAKLTQLLLAETAPAGMLSLQRLFVMPGEQRRVTMPRAEKAQYVGLAAGYYRLDPAVSTRLYRIGVDVDSSGIVIKNHKAAPAPLEIGLNLGPESILDAPGTRPAEVQPTQPKAGLVAAEPMPASGTSPKKQ
jgi:type VI secretion system VasD/TssJ family lipoprotein